MDGSHEIQSKCILFEDEFACHTRKHVVVSAQSSGQAAAQPAQDSSNGVATVDLSHLSDLDQRLGEENRRS